MQKTKNVNDGLFDVIFNSLLNEKKETTVTSTKNVSKSIYFEHAKTGRCLSYNKNRCDKCPLRKKNNQYDW